MCICAVVVPLLVSVRPADADGPAGRGIQLIQTLTPLLHLLFPFYSQIFGSHKAILCSITRDPETRTKGVWLVILTIDWRTLRVVVVTCGVHVFIFFIYRFSSEKKYYGQQSPSSSSLCAARQVPCVHCYQRFDVISDLLSSTHKEPSGVENS